MKIKFLKLINNERINKKVVSSKACEADGTGTDFCVIDDYADCSLNATDQCVKDYAGCRSGATDICDYQDYAGCYVPGSNDTCYLDTEAN